MCHWPDIRSHDVLYRKRSLQVSEVVIAGAARTPIGSFIRGDCPSRQRDHLVDRLVQIKTTLSRRRFLDVIADERCTGRRE
jgi:hypothetical protein